MLAIKGIWLITCLFQNFLEQKIIFLWLLLFVSFLLKLRMFHVVEFLISKTVAVVPRNWCSDGVTHWPNYRSDERVDRAVKNAEEPGPDWKTYDLRVVKSCGMLILNILIRNGYCKQIFCSVVYNYVLYTVNLKLKRGLIHLIFRSVLPGSTTVEEISDMQHIRSTVWRGGNSTQEKAKADVSIYISFSLYSTETFWPLVSQFHSVIQCYGMTNLTTTTTQTKPAVTEWKGSSVTWFLTNRVMWVIRECV